MLDFRKQFFVGNQWRIAQDCQDQEPVACWRNFLAFLGLGKLLNTFWVFQVGIFSVIPFILLMFMSLIRFKDSILLFFAPIVSIMILLQVLLMRWNVVVGGQLMSKSERGATTFHPMWLEKEGILPAVIIMIAPVVILWLIGKVLPFWMDDEAAEAV